MKEMTLEELAPDNGVAQQLIRPGVNYLVRFENMNFCSSAFGDYSIMAVGPDCSYRDLDDVEGRHINDLPSQRQHVVGYYTIKGEA